jgi:hypothetical protein
VAGLNGASAMTMIRLAAHRAGLAEKMTPQMVEQALAGKLGVEPAGGTPGHQAVAEFLHVGLGGVLGAAFALVAGRRAAGVAAGATFGAAVWGVAVGLVMPSLGLVRPPWRASPAENAVNLVAHVAFGVVASLVLGELRAQPPLRAVTHAEHDASRVA